jgi:hypothetical protein
LHPILHRISSDSVNCSLVEDPAEVMIVDAGLPRHWRELDAELTGLGRSWADGRGTQAIPHACTRGGRLEASRLKSIFPVPRTVGRKKATSHLRSHS